MILLASSKQSEGLVRVRERRPSTTALFGSLMKCFAG